MKKLFLLFCAVAISTTFFAQPQRTSTFKKAIGAPTIDGVNSEWANFPENPIDHPFNGESDGFYGPEDLEAYFKAAWCDSGFFVLIQVVSDDVHYDGSDNGVEWETDISEEYFDVNAILADGKGSGAGSGHHQFGGLTIDTTYTFGLKSYKITKKTDEIYCQEMFFAASDLKDENNIAFVPSVGTEIGFDVVMADNDGPDNNIGDRKRSRLVWANDGTGEAANQDWGNMDDAGIVTLSAETAAFGTTDVKYVTSGKVSAYVSNGTLTVNGAGGISELYDITGKLVSSFNGSMSVAALRQGLYIVRNNSLSTKVVIK